MRPVRNSQGGTASIACCLTHEFSGAPPRTWASKQPGAGAVRSNAGLGHKVQRYATLKTLAEFCGHMVVYASPSTKRYATVTTPNKSARTRIGRIAANVSMGSEVWMELLTSSNPHRGRPPRQNSQADRPSCLQAPRLRQGRRECGLGTEELIGIASPALFGFCGLTFKLTGGPRRCSPSEAAYRPVRLSAGLGVLPTIGKLE